MQVELLEVKDKFIAATSTLWQQQYGLVSLITTDTVDDDYSDNKHLTTEIFAKKFGSVCQVQAVNFDCFLVQSGLARLETGRKDELSSGSVAEELKRQLHLVKWTRDTRDSGNANELSVIHTFPFVLPEDSGRVTLHEDNLVFVDCHSKWYLLSRDAREGVLQEGDKPMAGADCYYHKGEIYQLDNKPGTYQSVKFKSWDLQATAHNLSVYDMTGKFKRQLTNVVTGANSTILVNNYIVTATNQHLLVFSYLDGSQLAKFDLPGGSTSDSSIKTLLGLNFEVLHSFVNCETVNSNNYEAVDSINLANCEVTIAFTAWQANGNYDNASCWAEAAYLIHLTSNN